MSKAPSNKQVCSNLYKTIAIEPIKGITYNGREVEPRGVAYNRNMAFSTIMFKESHARNPSFV